MDQSTHEVRRANWLGIINQCQSRPAGMSVKQWLEENDIKEKAYYYWLRKFRREAYNQMQLPATTEKTDVTFAEVTMPAADECIAATFSPASQNSMAAVIRSGGLSVEISNDISERVLKILLQEVTHA